VNKIFQLFDLSNKTIIVAGGSGQIGFALCQILAEAGANVAIADIDTELANDKISKWEYNHKKRIKVFYLNVRDKFEVESVFEDINTHFGKLYGLINSFHFKGNTRMLDTNSNFFSKFEDYPIEAWDMVHDVNLRGAFLTTQAIVPYLKENKDGVVVNISSTYGIVSPNKSIYGNSGINSPVAYASSKAAIINFTRYIATHLADYNIRANVLSPGGVFNNQSEEFIKNYTALTPLKRMAKSEDYQGAILFLMSNASSYMTGANLIVDGGWTAW